MGLTIHWELKHTGRNPGKVLEKIRQRAMDMAFDDVGPMLHFVGDECLYEQGYNLQDVPNRWFKIQADSQQEIMGFSINVALGSEPANIMLCKPGWKSRSFCKTQYASCPESGGVPNFLRAHISVITLLEYAQTLPGLKVKISDEGNYGSSNYSDDYKEAYAGRKPTYVDHAPAHDVVALAKEVGEWNGMIAAMVGGLKDALGEGFVAPITDFSNFEHLEMDGLKNMESKKLDGFLKALKGMSKCEK